MTGWPASLKSQFHSSETLLQEASRISRAGASMRFSGYSAKFGDDRLEWFRTQARHGFIVELDEHRSTNGTIICKDGFMATTVSPDEFLSLSSALGFAADIFEVYDSSILGEIIPA